jgi:hypothetical protein
MSFSKTKDDRPHFLKTKANLDPTNDAWSVTIEEHNHTSNLVSGFPSLAYERLTSKVESKATRTFPKQTSSAMQTSLSNSRDSSNLFFVSKI